MGKPVKLLAVPSNNPISAVVNVAVRLGCSRVYAGSSEKLSVPTQARLVGEAWEAIDDPDKIQFELIIVPEKGYPQRFQIGAHAPQMTPEDIELTHRIWLDIVEHVPDVDFHHRDVISMALRRFDSELTGASKDEIVDSLKQSATKERGRRPGRPRR
jgi:hypothetical protein